MISGTTDSLDGVSATARNLGIDSQTINNIYSSYGNTVLARRVCQVLGTTPEALKADADKIVGNSGGLTASSPARQGTGQSAVSTKFPRLK